MIFSHSKGKQPPVVFTYLNQKLLGQLYGERHDELHLAGHSTLLQDVRQILSVGYLHKPEPGALFKQLFIKDQIYNKIDKQNKKERDELIINQTKGSMMQTRRALRGSIVVNSTQCRGSWFRYMAKTLALDNEDTTESTEMVRFMNMFNREAICLLS